MNNKLDYIAIDFETANYYKNSACSVGLVRFIDGKETRTPDQAGVDAVFKGQDEILEAYSNGPLGDIRVSVWAKLFRRDMFSDIRFRQDFKIYEDAFYVYQCCRKAGKVCSFSEPLYLYRQRKDSVMHSGLSERYSDYFQVLDTQREEVKDNRQVLRKITKREVETALWLMRIMRHEGKDRELWELRRKLTGLYGKGLFSYTPVKIKLKLICVIIMPHIYFGLLKIRKN